MCLYYQWQGTNQWFELQDLHVTELLPQMITLAEAYIQVYSDYVFSCHPLLISCLTEYQ